jgi:threonine dehydrogenase-like Zn-dependent dehydrogenase
VKAVVWRGRKDVRVEDVDDPTIEDPTDAIVRVTATALCGSDLHLYGGLIPGLRAGDILGHEAFGIVESVGSSVELQPGTHVVVPVNVACGSCWMCERGLQSQCETTQNEPFHRGGSLLGYTHLYGGIPGAQAELLRVPMAHYGPLPVPDAVPGHRAAMLADVLPTAWQGVAYADVSEGDTLAVFGLGPVGQMCARVAFRHGAGRVLGVDHVPARLAMAERHGVETFDLSVINDIPGAIGDATKGRGADAVIDCVGMEADGSLLDRLMQTSKVQPSRAIALRHAVDSVRRGGTISIVGVYGGWVHAFPIDQLFDKQVQLRMGQANVRRWTDDLVPLVVDPDDPLDLEGLVTHRMRLEDAPEAYAMFREKRDGTVKVVFEP